MVEPISDPDRFALAAVQQYLHEHGYGRSLAALEQEAGLRTRGDLQRGSQLLQLVYGEAERQAAAALDDGAAERRALEEAVLAGGSGAGPGPCPSRLQRSIEGLHAANICAIQCWPGRREAVTGSSDGTLHVLSYIGELRRAIAASSSGVLALGLQGGAGSVVAAGCMDGSIVVVDAGTGVVLARAQPHRKYVVACRWAPDGRHLATGAWDDSFAVHRLEPSSDSGSSGWRLVQVYSERTSGRVNALEFLPAPAGGAEGPAAHAAAAPGEPASANGSGGAPGSSDSSSSSFLVAVQGSNYLRQLSISADGSGGSAVREARRINMNALGDDHVSFSAAHLAASPCGRMLLVSADNGRLVVFETAGWTQVRSIVGLPVEQFHQFGAAWHASGHYVAAAAAHGALCVFHLGTARRVATIPAHAKNVRALCYDGAANALLTCSFDRSVKVFAAAEAVEAER